MGLGSDIPRFRSQFESKLQLQQDLSGTLALTRMSLISLKSENPES